MTKPKLSVHNESVNGQELVALQLDTIDKEHKFFFTREQAIGLAQAILTKAWNCKFAIEKVDVKAEGK